MVKKDQEMVLAALALTTLFRKGVGEEAIVYRNFLGSLPGCDIVEQEFMSRGVQVEGTLDLSRPAAEAESGAGFRMISFSFKPGDLAFINETLGKGSAPLFQGTWRHVLERIIMEFKRINEEKMGIEEQLAVHTILRSIYRKK